MSVGIMVSINQRLDAETINLVADEFGFSTEYVSAEVQEAVSEEADDENDLVPRAPIVTVMGHVDHGKTSLLDHIRNTNVIAKRGLGGITQHIGAYSVTLKNGSKVTFLDTPGHEAFTAMRARGAQVTDIAIIIIAADDSVMPTTKEAIAHAQAAGVPMVFAINKIDKPGANPDKIREDLANMNLLVEEWGGKYQCQEISAKKGIGVDELMDKVLLEADLLELKANPNRKATGTVIESSLDKGRGFVSTVLVSNGTLKTGDIVIARHLMGQGQSTLQRAQPAHREGRTRRSLYRPRTQRRAHGWRHVPRARDGAGGTRDCQQARAAAARAGPPHAEAPHAGRHFPPHRSRRVPRAQHHRQGRHQRIGGGTGRLLPQALDGEGAGQRHQQGRGTDLRERRHARLGFRRRHRRLPGAPVCRRAQTG